MKFEILKHITPSSNPKNTYRVSVTCEHGDGDAETVETRDFKKGEEAGMSLFLELFIAISSLPDQLRGCMKEIEKCFTAKLSHLNYNPEGYPYEYGPVQAYSDFMCPDMFNCDRRATHTGIRVAWFDEDGVQHFVRVSTDEGELVVLDKL